MNRTERRAAQKQASSAAGGLTAADLVQRGITAANQGDLSGAAALLKKALSAAPAFAPACDRLALVYLAQGKRDKASAQYTELARIAPQTLNQFDVVLETLRRLLPEVAAALSAAQRGEASGGVPAEVAADPYFRAVLENTVVRDLAFERWLTALRATFIEAALGDEAKATGDIVAFAAALARQCWINEYVFAESTPERAAIDQLKALVAGALTSGEAVAPLRIAVLAMYEPLGALEGAARLAQRKWPSAVDAVVTQQVREPAEEAALRDTLPRLTPISAGVSEQVRAQYEENPYPRWVRLSAAPPPMVLDDLIRHQFPATPFRPLGKRDHHDILVAGCGTGRIALEITQSFAGARTLAIDLSLASLSAAKRKTPAALKDKIEFAQGDIMSIGSIGRDFDYINAGGVLHHMGDPLAGWRQLIKLMRPNALMQVGLYSAHARQEINEARKLVAARGYPATADGIRKARQELFAQPRHFNFMTLRDFFTTSEVRDLIFHVHEQQFTIPEIRDFIAANGLNFIGFEFANQAAHQHHRAEFQRRGWPLTDLVRWDAYERDNPDIFANMYVFWVQKMA